MRHSFAGGDDHYWELTRQGSPAQPAKQMLDPASGRMLDLVTTEPGVKICTASWLDGSVSRTGGRYGKYGALTLETHRYPDSPNHPEYPTIVLTQGQGERQSV